MNCGHSGEASNGSSPSSRSPTNGFGIGGPAYRTPGMDYNSIFRSHTRQVTNDDDNALLTSQEHELLALVDREGHEQGLRRKVVDSLSPEELSQRYLMYYTVSCPGCGARVQRDADSGGCPSVKCPFCASHFRCEIADY